MQEYDAHKQYIAARTTATQHTALRRLKADSKWNNTRLPEIEALFAQESQISRVADHPWIAIFDTKRKKFYLYVYTQWRWEILSHQIACAVLNKTQYKQWLTKMTHRSLIRTLDMHDEDTLWYNPSQSTDGVKYKTADESAEHDLDIQSLQGMIDRIKWIKHTALANYNVKRINFTEGYITIGCQRIDVAKIYEIGRWLKNIREES